MADDQGVTGTDSPTGGNQNSDVSADSSTASQGTDVSASSTGTGNDRPEQNWYREFQRKQQEQDKRLEAVLQYLVARDQAPAQQSKPTGPVTDEELWAQAQAGDRVAFEEYQRRIAQREISTRDQATRQQQIVAGQLQALVAKYPILNNPQHPLTQVTQQAYHLLLQNGYAPGAGTLLEAAKTAIADRPDLIAEHYSQAAQAREQVRQDNTRRAQSGMTGGTHRQENRQAAQSKVSTEAQELANRMGVKDPAKAMERFRKRQSEGRSSFGAVAAFIPEEDS